MLFTKIFPQTEDTPQFSPAPAPAAWLGRQPRLKHPVGAVASGGLFGFAPGARREARNGIAKLPALEKDAACPSEIV